MTTRRHLANPPPQPWASDMSSRPPRAGAREHGPAPRPQILEKQGSHADWATTASLGDFKINAKRILKSIWGSLPHWELCDYIRSYPLLLPTKVVAWWSHLE